MSQEKPTIPRDQTHEQPPIRQSMLDQMLNRVYTLPWWIVALVLLFIYAGWEISHSERYQDILDAMLDHPKLSTSDKFNVVYEVNTEVIILDEQVLIRHPDGTRSSVPVASVVERRQGTLTCDKEVDQECLNEFGELVVFQVPAEPGETPDGTVQRQGLQRPIANAVELQNGELIVVPPEQIIDTQENAALECDRRVDPDCEDLIGTIVTFETPYVLQTALVTREDVHIQHPDGFQETVRPNRLQNFQTESCTREEQPLCVNGEISTAQFRERIIGVETARSGGTITIRTVDEQIVFVPRDHIIDMSTGLVECDRDASPRCNDFEGTIINQRGAVIRGELSLENNRALNIIPDGETSAIEIRKSDVVSETRTPENCRPEDETACLIEVVQADNMVAGHILEDTEAGLTIQTVEPVFVEIETDEITSESRTPLVCALNNLQGCNQGVWLTLLITFVAYGLALVGGLIIGLMRVSSNPILYQLSTLYVEVIRGMPLLVLLLVFAFVVGPLVRDTEEVFGIPIGSITQPPYRFVNQLEVKVLGYDSFLSEALLGLAVGYAAFLAEIFRAGIESIGRGQMEAARSLGMTYPQAMRKIILPQAVRVVLPPLGNDFIALLKDSALISALALPDLLQTGRQYAGRTFQPIPVFVVIALLYIIMTLFLSAIVRLLEKRFKLP